MKTITDILKKSDSILTKLIAKVKSSEDLEVIFRTALDSNLAKHCHFANYKNSELAITVTNASWATRLRYSIPDIIKQLQVQPEFKDITSIHYTIDIPQNFSKRTKNTPAKLSQNNEILWQKTLVDLKGKTKV